MEAGKLNFLLFLVSFAVLIPTLLANIGEFDDFYAQRAARAELDAREAYDPNPEGVTDHLNAHVRMALEGTNSTRRGLMGRKYTGPCKAQNPTDRCWRCRKNWATERKRLAKCVLGFGRKTVGGYYGKFYIVTDASDDNPENPRRGTLRHAVIQKEPLWIIFKRSMIITLKQELIIESHKTIDARGANVHIAYGAGLTVQFVKNVIIHGLHIHDTIQTFGGKIRDSVNHIGFRTPSDGDGINVYGSTNVWIDHISMSNCKDGLIDVIMGSTAITISNCHFTNHNDVMLFGANEQHKVDALMQITVAFNHFGKGLVQRMPRCRWGFFHVVNNDYTHWLMYAIGGSSHPTIISQGNRFIAPPNPAAREVTNRNYATPDVWKHWTWRSEGDLFLNGAFFRQSGNPSKRRAFSRKDMIKAKPGSFVRRLTRFSGSLNCKANQKC